jgi:hypothetical protein
MRSFVPVEIFSASLESLLQMNMSSEIARRVLSKHCLWIIRMSGTGQSTYFDFFDIPLLYP